MINDFFFVVVCKECTGFLRRKLEHDAKLNLPGVYILCINEDVIARLLDDDQPFGN